LDVVAGLSDVQSAEVGLKRHRKAVERTLSYLDEFIQSEPYAAPFGAIVGGPFSELRRESATGTARRAVAGFLLEGFSQGNNPEKDLVLVTEVLAELPFEKPRAIIGLGDPTSVLAGISAGVDIFDGTYPLTIADLGCALTLRFQPGAGILPLKLDLWSTDFRADEAPLVENCRCFTCVRHSRAYIHHLLQTHELLAPVLLFHHNLHHYELFFSDIRVSLSNGTFNATAQAWNSLLSIS